LLNGFGIKVIGSALRVGPCMVRAVSVVLQTVIGLIVDRDRRKYIERPANKMLDAAGAMG
jgi:hypothetical protein